MLTKEQKRKIAKTISLTSRTPLVVVRERILNNPKLEGRYTEQELTKIIEIYLNEIITHCIETQLGFQLPFGAGILIVGKFKPRENTSCETRAKLTAFSRPAFDPYICKWTWKSDKQTYWGNKVPSKFFKYRPRPLAKRSLNKAILGGLSSSKFFHLQDRNT